jgi:hypothetical protein
MKKGLLDAKYFIQKLIVTEGDDLEKNHPWIWEHDRWKELVFAVLTQVLPFNHSEIRQLTEQMSSMSLLDIESLSLIPIGKSDELLNNKHAAQMMDFFIDVGFEEEEGERSIIAICEVANGLSKYYNGKVQQYFRSYGEILLNDIKNKFSFTVMNEKETRQAFIYWLQNVLNLPLSLNNMDLQNFAEQSGVSVEELIKAADNMDLNLAYLDDMVQMYLVRRTMTKEGKEENNS